MTLCYSYGKTPKRLGLGLGLGIKKSGLTGIKKSSNRRFQKISNIDSSIEYNSTPKWYKPVLVRETVGRSPLSVPEHLEAYWNSIISFWSFSGIYSLVFSLYVKSPTITRGVLVQKKKKVNPTLLSPY